MIDMNDPSVQRLLGEQPQSPGVITPGGQHKSMVRVAGDEDHGMMSTTHLDIGKHEVGVIFRPKGSVTMIAGVLTVDVYAIPGEPVKLHMICPKCHHTLTVNADKKPIDWNPAAPSPFPRTLREVLPPESQYLALHPGVISVEEFQCTWELEDVQQDKGKDVNLMVSGSLCRFRAAIDKNVMREV